MFSIWSTHQFGELRRPGVRSDDSGFGHPVFIHSTKRFDRPLTLRRLVPTNQDAVGLLEIPHRRSLCEELRVGQHLKRRAHTQKQDTRRNSDTRVVCESTHLQVQAGFGVGVKYPPDALGGSHGDGALLRDDLVAIGDLYDLPSARLDELQVGGATLPHSIGFGWGVDLPRRCSYDAS